MTEEINEIVCEKEIRSFKKVLKWLKLFYILLALSLIAAVFFITLQVTLVGVPLTTIGCTILGLVALRVLKKYKGQLKDNGYIRPALAMSGMIIVPLLLPAILAAIFSSGQSFSNSREEIADIAVMKNAFNTLTTREGLRLSKLNKWNERLTEVCEPLWEPKYNSVNLEKYALNAQALRSDIKVSPDMVLAFPSVPGKDQVGGVELFRKEGPRSAYVLLVNGTMVQCRADEINSLKWGPEDPTFIPNKNAQRNMYIIIAISVIISIITMVHYRDRVKKRYISFPIITLLSGFAGGCMGGISETMLYIASSIYAHHPDLNMNVGIGIGAAAGVLAGVFFMTFVPEKIKKLRQHYESVFGYITLYGAITGLACSMTVHLFLILFYDHFEGEYVFWGYLYGLATGVFVSSLLRGIFRNDTYVLPKQFASE